MLRILAVASLTLAALHAHAQYPARPISLVIPAPPGGGTDGGARIVAAALSERLGQRVVPENRPGAAGIVGTGIVAKAAPDGYTLGALPNVALTSAVASGRELPYKLDDFVPIGIFAFDYTVITSNAAGPWHSLKQVVDYSAQNPQKLNYGGPGIGSMGHIGMEVIKLAYGVDVVFVPFGGSGLVVTALLGQHVDLASSNVSVTLPFIKSGKLRPLAVTSSTRLGSLPGTPTVAELAAQQPPNFWFGLFAPAKTPTAVVDRVSAALEQVLRDRDTVTQLEKAGLVVEFMNFEASRKLMAEEISVIARLAKSVKLQ